MSASLTGLAPGDYGALTQAISDATATRQTLQTLTQQIGDGLVADTYAGLGQNATISLDLNLALAQQQTWQTNIDAATTSMNVTQNAVTQIQAIASSFYAQLNNLNGLNASAVDSTAASAQQALQQVANLLDATDGQDNYVFAGQDSANPPVPNPDAILSSGFYTQINAAVGALGSQGASATASATLAIATSNAAGTSPFSAYLSQSAATLQAAAPSVQVGTQQRVTIGLPASANAFVASTGSSTTGSYMRDVLRGLATIASLSSGQINDAGFAGLVQDTRASLQGAITAMSADTGVLGDLQSGLTTIKAQISSLSTALTTQVSNVQNVDQAATISRLQLTQTQLQASYQLISTLNGLSLAKFLPAS